MRSFLIYIVFLFSTVVVVAQEATPNVGIETQPWKKDFMEGLTVGGYYRFFGFDRKTSDAYDDLDGESAPRTISVVDPTYYDPLLFLYLGGNLGANGSFGAELRVDQQLTGANSAYDGSIAMFNGLVLRANTKTKNAGGYDIRFGGIEWLNITPFTFGQNTGYQRYSIFNRRPWDPGGNVKQRAASYYHSGTINQDVRFGTNAFKGFMVNVSDLPNDLSGSVLYGFSSSINGFEREAVVAPKKIYGGKLVKDLGALGEVGVSTYNTVSYQDSIAQNYDVRKRFHMAEVYSTLHFKDKLDVMAEIGYGVNKEPLYADLSGMALLLDFKTDKAFTKLPINLRLYKFDKYFINLDSYVGNTTTTPYLNNFYSENGGTFRPAGAQLTTPGSTVNNRVGVALNTEFEVGKLKVITGVDVSQDIERFSDGNSMSYGHRINGLDISRFVQFPNPAGSFGPNARMGTFYRGAYEVVNVSDTADDGGLKSKLFYSSADVQLKYRLKLFNRDLYLFNLNTFSSIGNSASVVPDYSSASYISARYHEFEAYYHIWRDITVSAYYGLERVKGNDKTDIDVDSGLARDQTGNSVGLGVDYQINNDTFLYLRQRFYSFEDKNFTNEKFSGQVFTVELKIFF